jgi:hypothetical protein
MNRATTIVPAAALAALALAAHAQPNYTSRNGQLTVYCGQFGGVGPLLNPRYLTLDPTHDSAHVEDSGPGRTDSFATAWLDADAGPTGVFLRARGESARGPFGTGAPVFATADSRDSWSFTLAQPACFTLFMSTAGTSNNTQFGYQRLVTLAASGSGVIQLSPGQNVTFVQHGDQLGAPPWSQTFTGSLSAGTYQVEIFGRSEGTTSPFAGSFDCTINLTIGPDLPVASVSPASICLDDTATFSVATSGAGPFTYQWQAWDPLFAGGRWMDLANGSFSIAGEIVATVSGATAPDLDWLTLAGGQHRLRCIVTSPCGTTTSNEALLDVKRPDINEDGNANQDDVDLLITIIAGGTNPGIDPDINADGSVDQGDVDALLDWISGGACP